MEFKKDVYRREKEFVIDLIKNTHDWENTEGFIADGVFNPEVYEKEKIKVLVILAETYGYAGNGETNIEDQMKEDIIGLKSASVQSPRKIAALLWLLLTSEDKGRKISQDEFSESGIFKISEENYLKLQAVVSRIAWINVKKASNSKGTEQDYEEIYNNSFRNKEIIQRQVTSIAPDLVIVCSNPVIDSLVEMEIFGEGITYDKNIIQLNRTGQRVINLNHPRFFADWGYEGVYKTFEIIHNSMNNK